MDKKNNSGGNGFNVFILGIFIGVLATLLLTTKKGRRILKIIINEGTERISRWEDVVDSLKTQEEDVDLEDDEPIMGEKVVQLENSKEPEGDTQENEVEEEPLHAAVADNNETKGTASNAADADVDDKPKKKSRFFKGTHKKNS